MQKLQNLGFRSVRQMLSDLEQRDTWTTYWLDPVEQENKPKMLSITKRLTKAKRFTEGAKTAHLFKDSWYDSPEDW